MYPLFLLGAPPLLFFALQVPFAAPLSIFTSAILLWFTEALPLAVTGLLIPLLIAFHGITPASKAFLPFGGEILFLFIGCFLLSRAIEKHHLDKRCALSILSIPRVGGSAHSITIVLAATSFFLSMWMSNASATAIMTTISLGILASLSPHIPDLKASHNMAVRLLLSCSVGASLGGLATPVGSPPNLIAVQLLAAHGITVTFLEWMRYGLPLALIMFLIFIFLIGRLLPVGTITLPTDTAHFVKLRRGRGGMSHSEKTVLGVFLATVSLWILPSLLHSLFPDSPVLDSVNGRLSMSVVGLCGGLALFFLPESPRSPARILNWSDGAGIDWGTILLFGGGLALGDMLEKTGVAAALGHSLFSGGTEGLLLAFGLAIVAGVALSEFCSNTASASILLPLILALSTVAGLDHELTKRIVIAITCATSFGFMLPVSTPPNAIVYGTGKVPAREMARVGAYFDLVGISVLVAILIVSL